MTNRLWEPCRIGRMDLKNRMVMPPMVTNYGTESGSVTDRGISYYEARAKGGVGLIILEATYVHPHGRAFSNQLGLSEDGFIPGMERLATAIHRHGARAAVQLHHGGRMVKSAFTQAQPVGPSPRAGPGGELPRELSVEEIRQIVGYFAQAAVRAKKAGFDGVELHAAHGYLIDQFISHSSNKRQDEYGGDLRNRGRFLVEIIGAIRTLVGEDLAVWCRINGRQYGLAGPTPLEDAQQTARMAQDAGADAIHVSAGGPKAPVALTTPTFVPAVIADLAEGVKKAVTVPVIAVGRFTPQAAEELISEGRADLVAVGKGLLADPDFPAKAASGNLDDINPCIVCFGCLEDLRRPGVTGIRCTVNPALGRERETQVLPATRRKKVLVIGGGPAGMEAALVAALRGHQIALWEKGPRLGGQLVPAAIAPHKDRLRTLNVYLQARLGKLGVKVETGKEGTAASIRQFKPDVLVLAIGARPLAPEIKGLNKGRVVQAVDVLEGKVETGDRVVVIGGELVGCETAEYLAEKGKKVTVTRRGPEMATRVGPRLRSFFLERLEKKGVTLLAGVTYEEINSDGLVVTGADGARKTIDADTIVLAAGAVPEQRLHSEIEGMVPEVHVIGDCVEPRTVREAIAEGYAVALAI